MGSHCKVLWPSAITSETHDTYIYGWMQPLYCVAGVLRADTLQKAEALLLSSRSQEEWNVIQQCCGSLPAVIGRTDSAGSQASQVQLFGEPGERPAIVYYRRPNLRYLEIYALDFQIYANARRPSLASITSHDFTAPSRPETSLGPLVLAQLNYGTYLDQHIQLVVRGEKTRPSTRSYVFSALLHVPDWPVMSKIFNSLRAGVQSRTLDGILSGTRDLLGGISACCNQVDTRLEQGILLPKQIPRLYRSTVPSTSNYISFYVHFWNTVWLILNDITIGLAFGTFLSENALPLATLLSSPLKTLLVHLPRHALLWLNNWPAGLKLNTELSQFYCHSLLGIVVAWSRVLETVLLPSLPNLIYIAGLLGTCGMTMTISMTSDLLSCFTLHLFICYRASALIFSYQLSIAGSLWNLFRGKRYNILRNRKDAWDYDVDQLLLGTMLFTLVAFLSPTTLTYYSFFAMARLFVVVVHAALDTALVLMNHFPLFALLLRIKSPLRMPGGVFYRLPKDGSTPTLEIQPIAFGRIFDHYGNVPIASLSSLTCAEQTSAQ
ncbi:Gpi1-domain-containing protein [Cristinia sonorae]|uniref:Gpi1-domain-containing protein n=1 Tax=Cristinia sonorae TaxID=1940300 RepID=A0A8K0UTH7_9AGAR|nr:Gpi1-domain-containing protein [Cristinia sonorae]